MPFCRLLLDQEKSFRGSLDVDRNQECSENGFNEGVLNSHREKPKLVPPPVRARELQGILKGALFVSTPIQQESFTIWYGLINWFINVVGNLTRVPLRTSEIN